MDVGYIHAVTYLICIAPTQAGYKITPFSSTATTGEDIDEYIEISANCLALTMLAIYVGKLEVAWIW
jgi:hypothetical protein